MAWGIAIFSLTSLLMPLALSGAVSQAVAMHLTLLIVSNALDQTPLGQSCWQAYYERYTEASTHLLQVAAAALTFPAVLATRVCIGLGEGVALPAMNNMVAGLPREKRSTALGIAFTGFHCGRDILCHCVHHAAVCCLDHACQIASFCPAAPLSGNLIGLAVSPIILAAFGWRSLFLIFGILGGPLLAFWLSVVPSINPKGVHRSTPYSLHQWVKKAHACVLTLCYKWGNT